MSLYGTVDTSIGSAAGILRLSFARNVNPHKRTVIRNPLINHRGRKLLLYSTSNFLSFFLCLMIVRVSFPQTSCYRNFRARFLVLETRIRAVTCPFCESNSEENRITSLSVCVAETYPRNATWQRDYVTTCYVSLCYIPLHFF